MYCGLTNLGIFNEITSHQNGAEFKLAPLQFENNLVLTDKTTGQVGQHINGADETSHGTFSFLLQKESDETGEEP